MGRVASLLFDVFTSGDKFPLLTIRKWCRGKKVSSITSRLQGTCRAANRGALNQDFKSIVHEGLISCAAKTWFAFEYRLLRDSLYRVISVQVSWWQTEIKQLMTLMTKCAARILRQIPPLFSFLWQRPSLQNHSDMHNFNGLVTVTEVKFTTCLVITELTVWRFSLFKV